MKIGNLFFGTEQPKGVLSAFSDQSWSDYGKDWSALLAFAEIQRVDDLLLPALYS